MAKQVDNNVAVFRLTVAVNNYDAANPDCFLYRSCP